MDFQDLGGKKTNGRLAAEGSLRSYNFLKKPFHAEERSLTSLLCPVTVACHHVHFSSYQAAGFLFHRSLLPQFLQGLLLFWAAGKPNSAGNCCKIAEEERFSSEVNCL